MLHRFVPGGLEPGLKWTLGDRHRANSAKRVIGRVIEIHHYQGLHIGMAPWLVHFAGYASHLDRYGYALLAVATQPKSFVLTWTPRNPTDTKRSGS